MVIEFAVHHREQSRAKQEHAPIKERPRWSTSCRTTTKSPAAGGVRDSRGGCAGMTMMAVKAMQPRMGSDRKTLRIRLRYEPLGCLGSTGRQGRRREGSRRREPERCEVRRPLEGGVFEEWNLEAE